MASQWHVRIVTMDDAEDGTGIWEPFAVVEDENKGPCVILKAFMELPGEKGSEHATE